MRPRCPFSHGLITTLGVASVLSILSVPVIAAAAPDAAKSDDGPGLVLLIAVDQLRRDRIDAALPGGLGRLAREGRVYTQAVVDHAMTETCPGHAVISTGRHPGRAGVPGNQFLDPETQEPWYCVEDRTESGRLLGRPDADPEDGRSPRNLRVDALGDWLQRASPESRVVAISGKDRAAITLGGRAPSAAYWFARDEPIGFTTSRHYADALPGWVVAWNGTSPLDDGPLARLPEEWTHPAAAGEDDRRGEDRRFGRTSGHPLRQGGAETVADRLYVSPWLDTLTTDFALRAIEEEGLGRGPATDLLAVSFSATDTVGHAYGPGSHESADALRRLDADLARLLAAAEKAAGDRGVLVALTSDHGVLPLPEQLVADGERSCPAHDLRGSVISLFVGLQWRVHREVAPFWSLPRQWVDFAGSQVAVRREVAALHGVEIDDVVAVVARELEQDDQIARTWTMAQIREGDSPEATLYRHSVDATRSGDLVVELAPTCLLGFLGTGTSHGTRHAYDREIPLLFHGRGIAPAQIASPAASVDVAPTLAAWLGIEAPDDLDGRVLFRREGDASAAE